MFNDKILKNDERAILTLREIYKHYGYLPFKMSKFEEYDLYVRNKDFLIGDSVITFNDTNGKLLALKPDVTLSIIKNTVDTVGVKHKVCYDENVYRVSARTHRYKEIMQAGLECIGDIDKTDVFEVVYLAARSLSAVSDNFVLDISHMGLFSAFLDEVSSDKETRRALTKLISEKNRHESLSMCERCGIGERGVKIVEAMLSLYGTPLDVIDELSGLSETEEEIASMKEITELCDLLSKTEFADKIRLDFSVVSDMRYYDGIVFKGFVNGVCEAVLSGGRYDPLMRRMGRSSGAVGFALYVDLLEELSSEGSEYDVDFLLIYSDNTAAETVIDAKAQLVAEGKSVCAQKAIPSKIRYKEIIDLDKEEI